MSSIASAPTIYPNAPNLAPGPVNDHGQLICPGKGQACGRAIFVSALPAKSGKNPGCFYTRCDYFTEGSSSAAGSSTSQPRKGAPCTSCGRKGNAQCDNKECLSCCLKGGGCSKHKSKQPPASSQATRPADPPGLGLTYLPSVGTVEEENRQTLISSSLLEYRAMIARAGNTVPPSQSSASESDFNLLSPPPSQDPPHLMPNSTPVTRIPDTLPQDKRPRNTRHLNAVWGRNHQDNTSGSRLAKGKQQNRKEVNNRFFVAMWNDDASEVNPIVVEHTECPNFDSGEWSVDESPTILNELGGNNVRFKAYMKDSGLWVTCTTATVLSVQSDCYVFIKRLDVKICLGFEDLVNKKRSALYPGLGNPKLLPVKQATASDSELEVLDTPVASSKKRKGKERAIPRNITPTTVLSISDESVTTTPRPSKKHCESGPSRAISDSPLVISSESSDESNEFPANVFDAIDKAVKREALSSAATTPGPSTAAEPMSGDLVRIPGTTKKWPFSLYVYDMVLGFVKMESLKGLPDFTVGPQPDQPGSGEFDYKKAFAVAFPGEFPPEQRTYRTHRQAWKKAKDKDALQDWIDMGRTDGATWRSFFKVWGTKKNN